MIDDIEKVKVNEEEIADYMPSIYRKLEWLDKEDIIKRMVSLEFNRFLEYYRDREEIEIPRENRGGERNTAGYERRERGSSNDKTGRKAEQGFTRIFISLGKADDFYPAQLIDLINKNTQRRIRLGRIDLMRSFSFFEVEEKQTQTVLKGLNNVIFNGRKVTVEVAGEESPAKGKNIKRKYEAPRPSSFTGNRKETHKKDKPGREERGYTNARGPKKKEDWQQFFKGEEPDFTEEGWAKRKSRK